MILARRRAWKSAAAFVLTAIVCFSPWWIRNLAWTGNPFFPQGSSIFADGGFSSQQIERWRIAHATPGGSGGPRDVQALASALHHQLISNWRFGFALVPLALIALFTRCDDQWKAARRMLVIVLALQVAFWLAFTHLQGRFLAGAIPLAALLIGTIPLDRRPLAAVAAIALLILAAGGIVPISRLMQDQNRVFGAREPALLWQLHPGVEEQLRQTDRPIALVGDARAFWWPLKSNRLFYRTVFDVDVRDGQMLVDAWLRGVPADAMVVIDPGELTRMARSYRGLGSVPPEVQARDRPYIAR